VAAQRGAGRFHLSLTHTAEVAVAFVVAERSIACSPS
jgi:phosphopantetheinyl transferase (holo-ACP synthase)